MNDLRPPSSTSSAASGPNLAAPGIARRPPSPCCATCTARSPRLADALGERRRRRCLPRAGRSCCSSRCRSGSPHADARRVPHRRTRERRHGEDDPTPPWCVRRRTRRSRLGDAQARRAPPRGVGLGRRPTLAWSPSLRATELTRAAASRRLRLARRRAAPAPSWTKRSPSSTRRSRSAIPPPTSRPSWAIVLLTVVNLARLLDLRPDAALRGATTRFERRFRAVEQLALAEGADVSTSTPDVLDAWWRRAKELTR
jgi:hypothetical protein